MSDGPLGIYGGTFDPVHRGHLALARDALVALELDSVIWIPAGEPPLRAAPGTPGMHRLEMVKRAIDGEPRFRVDDSEVAATGPSYTVTTLRRLRALHGAQRPLVLLLGADAFNRLAGWHAWRDLFTLSHLAVATRPGHDLAPEGEVAGELATRRHSAQALRTSPTGAIVPFAITPEPVSATAVRTALALGQPVTDMVPAPVLDYIDHYHLYH